ncbi:hypothetical protein GJAV_G00236850, partial [Gymnothorax javanicus]
MQVKNAYQSLNPVWLKRTSPPSFHLKHTPVNFPDCSGHSWDSITVTKSVQRLTYRHKKIIKELRPPSVIIPGVSNCIRAHAHIYTHTNTHTHTHTHTH